MINIKFGSWVRAHDASGARQWLQKHLSINQPYYQDNDSPSSHRQFVFIYWKWELIIHDITDILLKVALSTIYRPIQPLPRVYSCQNTILGITSESESETRTRRCRKRSVWGNTPICCIYELPISESGVKQHNPNPNHFPTEYPKSLWLLEEFSFSIFNLLSSALFVAYIVCPLIYGFWLSPWHL
jgi:hypothetical protein